MRKIIIGDIHGCYAELFELLDAAKVGPNDRIIALGDILGRGPNSLEVLKFFRDTAGATSIMGNHEDKHIRAAHGERPITLSEKIVRFQLGKSYGDWISFMETFPPYIELDEAILVHGFLEPGLPLEKQKDAVMIATFEGEVRMMTHHPAPWYDYYDGEKPVVAGHHSYLRSGEPVIRDGLVYGIDTGCVYGAPGRLTALILPGFEIVSAPSRGNHWEKQRLEFARK